MNDGTERRVKSLIDFWPILLMAASGIVAVVTFYNNVKDIVAEQKAFKTNVETRREKSHQDMEDIRTRLTKLEQWKEDTQ